MKYGLLSYKTSNIGDDIQSLAAKNFLPSVDCYLDRDNMQYDENEKLGLIMNGWFKDNPDDWPPSPNIDPLFISFHITDFKNSSSILTKPNSLDYFKKFEPVGCRDYWTFDLLKSNGIECYYSACLTLTLPSKGEPRGKEIIFTDAFKHKPVGFEKYFLKTKVPNEFKDDVVSLTHWNLSYSKDPEERFVIAQELLDRYAKAKLVITSRIHCLLPCLAFGTPVYFIDYGYITKEDRNRFDGILDLADVIQIPFQKKIIRKLQRYGLNRFGFKSLANSMAHQIDWNKKENSKQNKIDELKLKLKEKVHEYISKKEEV